MTVIVAVCVRPGKPVVEALVLMLHRALPLVCVPCYNLSTMVDQPMSDELSEDNVSRALTTEWFGRPYLYTPVIDSTNDRLKQMAVDTAVASGTVLLADYQSSGRGRMQRRWEAPPGTSLLFSVMLRPGWHARQATWLTMLAGLAVAESIESVTGLTTQLKWPNDVVIAHEDGLDHDVQWRKVCGLLLDVALAPDGRVENAILGIGLNVNIPNDALPDASTPPTSLLVAAGRPILRLPLLVDLLGRLEHHYQAAMSGQSPATTWAKRLVTLGQTVQVTAVGSAGTLNGMAESVDEWGQLLMRDEGGVVHTIVAGDVTLRRH